MAEQHRTQDAILNKLGIAALNAMQKVAYKTIASNAEVILLSPTGTGKTVAFLLPIIAALDPELVQVQVMILVPSRELAIQIKQVVREMGSGYKTNAVYGGRSGSKDKIELKHPPAILIGTPGRVADHIRRKNIAAQHIRTLVLDEYDKSLEVGFSNEMKEIVSALPNVKKKILTSATQKIKIPAFVGITNAEHLNFLKNTAPQLQLKLVVSPYEDKLETLVSLLQHIGPKNGIVFCNFKDSIETISDRLYRKHIDHVCFYGGLEQIDRERALIKFRNGTHRLLIATDLAARGIDVPELDFIIHYQLPPRPDEFVHRNGRTARMNTEGTAYVLKWEKEMLPPFIKGAEVIALAPNKRGLTKEWETLYISGGRKDKISKGVEFRRNSVSRTGFSDVSHPFSIQFCYTESLEQTSRSLHRTQVSRSWWPHAASRVVSDSITSESLWQRVAINRPLCKFCFQIPCNHHVQVSAHNLIHSPSSDCVFSGRSEPEEHACRAVLLRGPHHGQHIQRWELV